MQAIVEKQKCSGCSACYNSCPVHCIHMTSDNEGFLYPEIDENKCIDCGLCKKICPVMKKYEGNNEGRAYSCINKDEEKRLESSSGGVFTLLAEYVINNGGKVFGALFDDEFNVLHISCDNVDELSKIRGSKYVQSRIENTYKEAEECLKSGALVLFSGTPCQISGLKAFLRKSYENLITADIICHGVPSPKVWRKYLDYREEQAGAKVRKISFRNKKSGWTSYSVYFEFDNGTEYVKRVYSDLYMKGFLSDIYLRPSCYNCHFKSLNRESDITLADFWGVWDIAPEMFDNKGTSLVFVNTKKGQNIFKQIEDKIEFRETDLKTSVKYNSAAYKSVKLPHNRKRFFKNLDKIDLPINIEKNIRKSFIKRIFIKTVRITKKAVLKLIKIR